MNPADLTTAIHPTTQTTSRSPATHLKIIELELPQQNNPCYDVTLRLSRPLTDSESHELTAHRSIGLDFSPDDPSQLIATHTTVEEVQDRLPEFHELLTAAAAGAHTAQDPAAQSPKAVAVEEARRQSLVSDTNARFGASPHTVEPVVDAV
ncbi:MAG: hypothetical protein WBZ15_26990 [Mycobacterium sp.]|uniref:hypothetical protein n=1 Tax=Mycobacterium sp. TaxID=1785 RepID=UPI003C355E5F